MQKANYQIFGSKGNVTIKKEGNSKATKINVPSRAKAYEITKKLSANQGGGEIIIHGLNGKINVKNTISPGNDPRNIPG